MAIAQNKLVEKAEKEYEYLTGDEATRRWQELRENLKSFFLSYVLIIRLCASRPHRRLPAGRPRLRT